MPSTDRMMFNSNKQRLLDDLWPLLRMMRWTGFWTLRYYDDASGALRLIRILYASFTTAAVATQLLFMFLYMLYDSYSGDQLVASTITFLFLLQSLVKYIYFAFRSDRFFRCLNSWNTINSHPLFAESHARHRVASLTRSRRLIKIIGVSTILTAFAWTVVTLMGDSTREMPDPDEPAGNITACLPVPRLMIPSHYFWDPSDGWRYFATFSFQMYFLLFALAHANIMDTMFSCFVIFAAEQLRHLKESLRPLMALSTSLDTPVNDVRQLFRPPTAADEQALINRGYTNGTRTDLDLSSSFWREQLVQQMTLRSPGGDGGWGTNGFNKKQELLVRSAIKYWVERHKHVVKYVGCVGDTYGLALLLHMLISTVTLTLLAYQATKIHSLSLFSVCVVGYLFYSLSQVFLFCIHGNELVEQSTSMMEAAYSCHWYDGSEEAKTFVQIICQQCQKSLVITGAKFFIVSLDLFASVLGAVVTYFMVLIQLK